MHTLEEEEATAGAAAADSISASEDFRRSSMVQVGEKELLNA
jgi:hypothetical protein